MNKKVKWGIIIVIAAELTGLGIHSAEYDTKMCEISLLQLSGGITTYLQ